MSRDYRIIGIGGVLSKNWAEIGPVESACFNSSSCSPSVLIGSLLEADERVERDAKTIRLPIPFGFENGYTPSAVDVYKSETREVIRRFFGHRLCFAECIAALDSALTDLIPRLTGEQTIALRCLAVANNEIVMKEMERRGAGTPS